MLAAHEMFKNANRVSRAEKALILGFMAGARGTLTVCTSLVLCSEQQRYIRIYKCKIALHYNKSESEEKKGGREKYIGGNPHSHPPAPPPPPSLFFLLSSF